MNQPVRRDSTESTKDRILRVARALFAEQGYTAASISKIAKAASVLPGSIYWAFESKELIFIEALKSSAAEWKEAFAPRRSGAIADLPALLADYAPGYRDGPEFLKLLMVVATEHQASDPRILAAAIEVRRAHRETVEALIVAGLADMAPATARRIAVRASRLLLELLDGMFLSLRIERTEVAVADALREVGHIVLREIAHDVNAARHPGGAAPD